MSFDLEKFLKKMLDSRTSASEQRHAEKQLERQENNQEVSQLNWLGIDSNTGEGIALNANNQPVRGNIIFNSQQVPGQSILGLNAAEQTLNAMPSPWIRRSRAACASTSLVGSGAASHLSLRSFGPFSSRRAGARGS